MNKKGLTLLEIMVSMFIFVLILGSVIPALTSVQNAGRVVTSEVQMNELCNRVTMNAALKLAGARILVVEPDKISFQKVIGIYPEIQLAAVEGISFTDMKKLYPEIDDEFKGKVPAELKQKYNIDPAIPLKGLFFYMKDDDMLIGISVSGTGNEKYMTKTFYLETKLLGDIHE